MVNNQAHLHIGTNESKIGGEFVMALYSFSVNPISRLKGESVVKAAAYQSRGRLFDEREGTQYDFTHKTDILYTEIFLPSTAPLEYRDRQNLWTTVDRVEKRYDARTGRVVIAALPNELTLGEQIKLVRDFILEAFVGCGMCADVAIHSGKRKYESQRENESTNTIPNNPHVHILITDRPMNEDGFCAKKNRDWIERKHIKQWRKLWEEVQNREFERKGLEVRVSHESLEVQGIDREPTKHLGRKATEMIRRGQESDRYKENRVIETRNNERIAMKHERKRNRDRDRYSERSR